MLVVKSLSLVGNKLRNKYLAGRATDQLPAFLLNASKAAITRSTIRASYSVQGAKFSTEHRGIDGRTFEEIFVERLYNLPEALGHMIPNGPITVLDLGGNVGYFGLWAQVTWRPERLIAFEPDPANAHRYRELKTTNSFDWEIIEAYAATEDGNVRFTTGRLTSGSKSIDGSGANVRSMDVLPYMADAHIIKMDIEGAEWGIVSDIRMRDLTEKLLVIEYHPFQCPDENPREVIIDILTGHGFNIHELFFYSHLGMGMLWAYKSPMT